MSTVELNISPKATRNRLLRNGQRKGFRSKMAITEYAKKYHEKLFPGYVSSFLQTDPEFIERFDNFTFDEVVNHSQLDEKNRWLAILSTLIGCQ